MEADNGQDGDAPQPIDLGSVVLSGKDSFLYRRALYARPLQLRSWRPPAIRSEIASVPHFSWRQNRILGERLRRGCVGRRAGHKQCRATRDVQHRAAGRSDSQSSGSASASLLTYRPLRRRHAELTRAFAKFANPQSTQLARRTQSNVLTDLVWTNVSSNAKFQHLSSSTDASGV